MIGNPERESARVRLEVEHATVIEHDAHENGPRVAFSFFPSKLHGGHALLLLRDAFLVAALTQKFRKSRAESTVTENASRMLLHLSPSGTALKLHTYLGPRAEQLVEKWIVSLVKMAPLPITGIAFWCDVGMRLKGFQPSECDPKDLSAFDRTRFDAMLARVGMKRGGYSLGGRNASRHPVSHVNARRV